MKEEIKKLITVALQTPVDFTVEYPGQLAHGDYATNVALILAKQTGKAPKEVAEEIVVKMTSNQPEWLDKVEVAGPGFINFHLAPQFFALEVAKINNAGAEYGRNQDLRGEKVMVEYTQPNPFKEFHIGHLMNNVIGESVSRLQEWGGGEVKRATYHGDVGMHVAKTIWGLDQLKPAELTMKAMGEAYAHGNAAFEDNTEAKEQITALNKEIYARSDEPINKLYDAGRRISLEYFEAMYARLGSHFDYHFFESEAGPRGAEIVKANVGKVFEESEGAVVFRGENYGLHTRVFVSSQGLPTYEAKEVGLQEIKQEQFPFTRSITVTANEQTGFFSVVRRAIELLYPQFAGQIFHVPHGMLRLPDGKMSSRKGTIIAAETLLDDVEERVKVKVADRELGESEKEQIAKAVALAAIKYSILKQSPGKDIIFDFDKSLSFEGDSGPYLQYTCVRARSILQKAGKEVGGFAASDMVGEVERLLPRFPEVAERAARELAPNYVVTYLLELASAFNAYYANNKIIGSENESYRLALTQAVAQVIESGLWLLGIPVPQKM